MIDIPADIRESMCQDEPLRQAGVTGASFEWIAVAGWDRKYLCIYEDGTTGGAT